MFLTSHHHAAKLFFLILFLCSIFSFSCGGERKDYLLTKKGESPYAIVLSGEASPSEKHAADELQMLLKMATGAKLPIVEETDSRTQKPMRIFIGSGMMTGEFIALGKPVNREKLGDEGFIIRTVKKSGIAPDVIIAGGRLRGTLYGVYTFLDHLGFRWYTNRKTWYPEGSTLRMPHFDKEEIPAFMYREPSIYEVYNVTWAARNRINGVISPNDTLRGGRVKVNGVHTFDRLIPHSLFKEHPEYFPLIGGKRVTGYVQRCLTNPDVVKIAAENLIKWIDSQPNEKIFSLSASDIYGNLCECVHCQKIMEEEDSPAGLYLHFVNQVAEIVEKKYPDKYISTLAYHFTEKPPRTVKPRHNVIIRVAPIEICVSHPFTECSEEPSVRLRKHLEGWSRLTSRIFIWHYNTDFSNYLMPFPNFKEFTADIKTYHKNGVRGIYFQGSNNGPGGSDADLRAWVMARLLWDPYQDGDALVNEWMHGVYGRAYEPMRTYFDLMHERVADPDHHLHIFEPPTREKWPDHVVASMDSLHEVALSIADGDTTSIYYIKKNRMAVKFIQHIMNTGHLQVVDGAYRPVENKVTVEDHDRFIEYIKPFGVKRLREEWCDANFPTLLRQRVETHTIVTIENEDLRLDVVPNLGGRIVRLIHKMTGENLLHPLDPTDNFYPVSGGYEEMTAHTWGCTGFSNSYESELKGRKLILTGKTNKGLLFTRTISLPEHGARINFSSSIINKNEKPTIYRLVCRMHLNCDPDRMTLKARTKDGIFIKPVASEDRTRWGITTVKYDGPNKPAGAWRLENVINGHTIENRFRDNEVASCILAIPEEDNMVRMEIQSPEREVEAGGRITINHIWEIK